MTIAIIFSQIYRELHSVSIINFVLQARTESGLCCCMVRSSLRDYSWSTSISTARLCCLPRTPVNKKEAATGKPHGTKHILKQQQIRTGQPYTYSRHTDTAGKLVYGTLFQFSQSKVNSLVVVATSTQSTCMAITLQRQGFFLEMQFWGESCFCGERKCEEYPKNTRNLLLFGGEIQNCPEKNTVQR